MDRDSEEFAAFFEEVEPRVRYALAAAYGPERGHEGAAEAFAYAWEHWNRISKMANPAGYVYRAGQHYAARLKPRTGRLFQVPAGNPEPIIEPGLARALEKLSVKQRAAVVLIRGYGYTHREVADLLGIRIPSVQKHLERGLAKLRSSLGVTIDA
jgi:RNA polymerase sigma-70 factor (ECF subfamily)